MVNCISNVRIFRVCSYIKGNIEEISKELRRMQTYLKSAGNYYKAYLDKEVARAHLRSDEQEFKYPCLEELSKRLWGVDKTAIEEVFQGIDFLNIESFLFDPKDEETDFVATIQKCQSVVYNLIYQVERIEKTDNIDKQIAIVKGMIAYN